MMPAAVLIRFGMKVSPNFDKVQRIRCLSVLLAQELFFKTIKRNLFMEFKVERIDKILIVKPMINRIDALNASVLKSGLRDFIRTETKVALDLSDVSIIDSAGLSAFISFFKSMGGVKENFAIYGINPTVSDIFKYTGVHKIWNIFNSKSQTLEFFYLSTKNAEV